MGSLKTFKEIKAWQLAIQLARAVYQVSAREPFFRDFSLKNQIRDAVVSISSNIAEGFEREGRKEFIQFLTVAKGSTAEVQTQIRIAWEVKYITDDEFCNLDQICTEIIGLISGFLKYLRSVDIEGNKFKRV